MVGSLTRVRNNQVYNSDIYASAKLVAKSVTGGLLSDNFTYAGNMTIGNLTVNGNTTTLDTTNLVVADPLLAINRNQSGTPTYDLGFVMGRGNQINVAMIWEETAKQFQLQYTSESTASTTYGTINNSGFANLQAYGILLNNATVGTLTVTSSLQAPSYTTTNGGQFTGYFTGAIGANTANSGAFTTLSTTGNATIQGNILVTGNIIPSTSNIYSLGSSANRFANLWIKGTTIYLGSIAVSDGGGYLQVTDPNTGLQLGIQTASINNTVIGNTGPAAATFTTATVNGTLYAATVNAGTIGNSGATFSGTSINLTGNASVNAISAYQVGNTSTILEGTIGSATPSQPNITSVGTLTSLTVSGTVAASTVNAGTIGNASATFNGASINLTGNASVNAISAYQVGNTSTILEGTIGSATPSQPNITSVGTLTSLTTSGNLTVGGNLNITGNINNVLSNVYSQGGIFYGAATTGFNALYAGQSGYTPLAQTILQVSGNYNGFVQINEQNTNSGASASTDFIATANNGNDNDTYIDMGINSSGYVNATYGLQSANDGYLYVAGNTTTGGGNLIISTTTANDIIYSLGGIANANEFARMRANTNSFVIGSTTNSTSTTTGALQIRGGAGVSGNLYVGTASYSPVYYYANGQNILTALINSAYSNTNAGAYLTTYTGNLLAGNITALNNITGYLNGVIGANAANSAAFTTVSITNTANSYGNGQGALQIGGGFYAGGDSYINGNLAIAGNLTSVGYNQLIANAPLLYLSVGSISTYNYELGFYSHKYDAVEGYNHTGFVRNHVDNAWYVFSNIRTEPGITVDLANANIVYDTVKLGNIIVYSGNTSTSTTTGAAVIYGGMGVGGNIYAAAIQNTPIGNGTASTGAFTTLTASGTITGAGQVVGYFNGAIGANTANSGTFTTVVASGNITAQTANVYAANIIGNTALYGAQFYWSNGAALANTITGLYGNSNVATYLPTYTGTLSPSSLTTNSGGQVIAYLTGAIGANVANTGAFTSLTTSSTIVSQGTITGAGQVVGYFNGVIGANNANSGTFTTVVASGNITAQTANVYAANLIGNTALYGAQYYWSNGATLAATITGTYGNSNVAVYLPTYTGNISAGNVNLSGALTSPNIFANSGTNSTSTTSGALQVQGGVGITGNIYLGSNVFAGTPSYNDVNIKYSGSLNVNSYIQSILQNTNNGTSASADFIVNNDQGTATTYYGDFGMNSSGFSGTGSLAAPNNVYLTSTSSDLVLGTTTSNAIRFVINGGATDAAIIATNGNIVVQTTTTSISNTTGALVVNGGVGVVGNIYSGANITAVTAVIAPNMYNSNIYPASGSDLYKNTGVNGNLWINYNGYNANVIVNGSTASGYGNLFVVNGYTGQVGIKQPFGSFVSGASLQVNSTDSIQIPVGTTAQRPATGSAGMIRYNTNNNQFEYYSAGTSTWVGAQGAYTTITENSFTGDNSTTVFTLSQNGTTNGTFVSVNGVLQIPSTAYSVSGTTLTFTEAPVSTDIIDARVVASTTTVSSLTSTTGGSAAIQANSSVYITGGIAAAVNPTTLVQNTPTTIDTFLTTTYRVAKYVIKVSDSTNGVYCGAELIVAHNGTTATSQVYGVVNTGANALATFSSTISGGNVLVTANTWSSTATATIFQTYMPV
jgi:hypothetical protein